MKFLVDAHLPYRLKIFLSDRGYPSIHTSELPDGNTTTDHEIKRISIEQKFIVITKDSDFFYSHILNQGPYKVLFIRVGNLKKDDLMKLIIQNLDNIETLFKDGSLVEVTIQEIKLLL